MSNLVKTSIPWVGQIPTDWDIKPLFSIATENKNKNKEQNKNVLSLSYGRIIRRDLSKNFGLLPENFDGYQVVETGYIIIRSTDLQNDKKSLRVGLVKEYGVITSAYIGLSPSNSIHPEYLFYYLNMCDLKKVFYSLGGGLRQSLRFEEFKRFPVIVPSIEEQKLISRYLDKKTSQIDSLVEKIQKKIELLKEQRTSLINHYVTKGLDPNVEMKDSGVEWIGEIPRHWERIRVKHLVSTKISDGPHETPNFVDEGIPFLSVEGVVDNKIDLTRVRGYITQELHEVYSKKCKPVKDDILLVKSGSTTGKSTIVDIDTEFNIWSPLCILRSDKSKVSPLFLFNSVQSRYFITQVETNWSYGTQPNIGMGVVEELWVVVPPLEEQSEISKFLSNKIEVLDNIVTKQSQKIRLYQEYRQSLISSVVTGKVRVTEDMI